MSRLADLQQQFQQIVLEPVPGTTPSWVSPAGRAAPTRQLAAYQHAYTARLQEALGNDFPVSALAIGEQAFDALSAAYIARHPSRFFSLRDYGRDFPAFVAGQPEQPPWLAELTRFEWQLGEAFDAADAAAADIDDMAVIPPEEWPALRFTLHPSVRRLRHAWNTVTLWNALSAEQPQPVAAEATADGHWLVWRQALVTRFRSLEADEATALDGLAQGDSFGTLCDALAERLPTDQVPLQAAGWLKNWLAEGLIRRIHRPVPPGQPNDTL